MQNRKTAVMYFTQYIAIDKFYSISCDKEDMRFEVYVELENKNCGHLECDAMLSGRWVPTFQKNLLLPSSEQ
jgi:hypothetical protein